MIGMDLGGTPVGDLVGLAVPGDQRLALLITEDHQGLTPGGTVHPHSGDITAPACRLCPEVSQAVEVAALEKPLSDVLDAPLHLGLVLGVSHPGGVGDEAPVLGVFQEAPGEPGVQRVGPRHRGGEVVDDQILGDAAEEGPRCLQAQTLSNLAPSNAGDLAALLADKLTELATRIRTNNTDDWLQYWNEDYQGHPLKPKREEHCQDAFLSDLRGLLPGGVVAEPEGEYAHDGRADIRVVFGDFNVPVEVKKDRNRQLWSSLNDQLIARYASDPATGGHAAFIWYFGSVAKTCPRLHMGSDRLVLSSYGNGWKHSSIQPTSTEYPSAWSMWLLSSHRQDHDSL